MPATPITPAVRYYRPGLTKVYYCATIANKSAPTSGELNGGTDLSGDVAAIDGWQQNANFLDAPDLNSSFVAKVAGGLEASDSSLTMYQSSNSTDVRGVLPRGTTGFIVMLDEGQTTGRKADVYPVTVASVAKLRDLGEVARLQVSFAITSSPAENVSVP